MVKDKFLEASEVPLKSWIDTEDSSKIYTRPNDYFRPS